MGKEKYLREIESLFEKSPVVSYSSINRIIQNKKRVKQYTKLLVRNLILKGKIKRLAKGYYSLKNEPSLLVYCIKPSYLGLQNALSFYNLWEQETIPVIITSKKVRNGIRKIDNGNILIRRIDKKYLFGFDYVKEGDIYLPYSDIEKTFIDMIYFKERMDEKTIKNMVEKFDKKKLNSYLKKYPDNFRKKVLKYLEGR